MVQKRCVKIFEEKVYADYFFLLSLIQLENYEDAKKDGTFYFYLTYFILV